MKASQFYHLISRSIRKMNVNEECELGIFKIYFKRMVHTKMEENDQEDDPELDG
jgi:hypothetical protein